MNNPIVPSRYLGTAQTVAQIMLEYLPNIELDPAQIKRWQLLADQEDVYLLATLDININNPEAWQKSVHKIQTAVRNRVSWARVGWVNSTGWRIAVKVSKPKLLPRMAEFPGVEPGKIRLGVGRSGPVEIDYDGWLHMIVAGMSGSGKSTFAQSLVHQAIAAGCQLMIADLKAQTFRFCETSPQLLKPIAMNLEDTEKLVDYAWGEIEHRKELFREMGPTIVKLSEYNEAVVACGLPALPRVVVMLDEFLVALGNLGGKNGRFAGKVWNLLRFGRSYGMHIVITVQDVDKDSLGGMRDQFGQVVCFRLKNPDTARNLNVRQAAEIPDGRPGLAFCDPWGWVQFYMVEARDLMAMASAPAVPQQSDIHRMLFQAAQANDGKLTRGLIGQTLQVGDRQARKIQGDLEARGWIVKDPNSSNAFRVSDRWTALAGADSGAASVQPSNPSNPSNRVQPVGQPKNDQEENHEA
jgi:ABC-type oligopeptide transport system ATPase subunit